MGLVLIGWVGPKYVGLGLMDLIWFKGLMSLLFIKTYL